jgi:hypothetical protein
MGGFKYNEFSLEGDFVNTCLVYLLRQEFCSCRNKLWLAIDLNNSTILAFTFEKRKEEVFREPKEILAPFGVTMSPRMIGETMCEI